ncbi:MAG: hypothetical protein ACXV5S_07755 [Acidimicrobiales bacterium]
MTSFDDTAGQVGPVPEHRERVEKAASALAAQAARPAADRRVWAEDLRRAALEMIDALAMHIDETEQPGGLYDEIMADTPRLAHAVDMLRRDHVALLGEAAALIQAAAVPPSAIDPSRLLDEVTVLVGAVHKHQRRGIDLLYDFYQVDIGIGE